MNLISWLTTGLTDDEKKKITESGAGYTDRTIPEMGPLTDAAQKRVEPADNATYVNPLGNIAESVERFGANASIAALDVPVKIATGVGRGVNWLTNEVGKKITGKEFLDPDNGGNQFYDNIENGWKEATKAQRDVGSGADEQKVFDERWKETLGVWNSIPEAEREQALKDNPVLLENLRLYQDEVGTKGSRDQTANIAGMVGTVAGTAAPLIIAGGAAGMAATAATPGIIAPAVTGALANVATDIVLDQALWRPEDEIKRGTKVTGNETVDNLLADMSTRKGGLVASAVLGLFSEATGSLSKLDDAAKNYTGAMNAVTDAKNLTKETTKIDNQLTKSIRVMKNLGYTDEEISSIYNAIEKSRPKASTGVSRIANSADEFAGETTQRSDLFNEALGISDNQMAEMGQRALPAPTTASRGAIALDNAKVPEVSNRNIQPPELPKTGNKTLLDSEIGSSSKKRADIDAWMWKNKEAALEMNAINSKAIGIDGKSARATFVKNATEELRAKYVDQYVQETAGATADLTKTTQLKVLKEAGVDTKDLEKASNAAVQDVYETSLKGGRLKNVDMSAAQPTATEVTKVAARQEASAVREVVNSMFEEEFGAGNISTIDDLAAFLGSEDVSRALKASSEIDPEGHDAFLKVLKKNAQGIVDYNGDTNRIALEAWKESPFHNLLKDKRIQKTLRQLRNNEEPTLFGRTGSQSAVDEIAQEFADTHAIGDGSVTDFFQALDEWQASKPTKTIKSASNGAKDVISSVGKNTNMMGAVAGIETDENGKMKFDPMKGAIGVVGSTVGPKVVGAISDAKLSKSIDDLIEETAGRTTKTTAELIASDPRLQSVIKATRQVAPVAPIKPAGIVGNVQAGIASAERGVSKLGADLVEKFKKATDLQYSETGTAGYDIKHVEQQAKMTEDLINTDFDRALRIADGIEELPSDMSSTMLYKALSDKAVELKDGALANRLANSSLASESSKHAQELRFMQEIDPTDPLAAIKKVNRFRAKATSKYLKNVPLTDDESKHILELSDIARKQLSAVEEIGDAAGDDASEAIRMAYGEAQVQMNDYIKLLQDPTKNMGIIDTAKNTDWVDMAKHPLRTLFDASGISKALNSSMDDSGIFRPGIKMLTTNPKEWAINAGKSFMDIFDTFKGNDAMDGLDAWIVSRPKYLDGTYKKAGLAVQVTEEAFPTSLPEKLPGYFGKAFKASEAAFTGLQKRNRIYAFDKWLELAKEQGQEITDQRLKNIAFMANSLTGRGDVGKFELAADSLNKTFYSFRNLKGNWDTLTAHQFSKGFRETPKGIESNDAWARKLAATNLMKTAGSIGGVLFVADMVAPGSVEWDPRSSDFGTIRVGNTRFDITGGMKSIVTLIARGMITPDSEGNWGIGRTKSSTTDLVTPLNTGEYGGKTVLDVGVDFFGNKLSPIAGQVRDWVLKGTDFEGEKPTVAKSALSLITPFPASSAAKTLDDPNAANFVLTMIMDGLGIQSSTYGNVSDIKPSTVYNLLDKTDNIEESKTVINKLKERGASNEFIKDLLSQYYKELTAKEKAGDPTKDQKPNPKYKPDREAQQARMRMLNELLN